jgi:hypothetical protein
MQEYIDKSRAFLAFAVRLAVHLLHVELLASSESAAI